MINKFIISTVIFFMPFMLFAQNNPIKNFPESQNGKKRQYFTLPKNAAESNFKVELIIGKYAEVDCNRHILQGEIIESTLTGFGYPLYEFNSNGLMASTKMLCPNKKLQSKFITSESKFISYNSKLPVVAYLPEGFELHYKIWSAGKEIIVKSDMNALEWFENKTFVNDRKVSANPEEGGADFLILNDNHMADIKVGDIVNRVVWKRLKNELILQDNLMKTSQTFIIKDDCLVDKYGTKWKIK